MNETRPNKQRKRRPLLVEKVFELPHALHHQMGRRRDERGIPRPRAANPVLTSAEFARLFVAASPVREEDSVNLANETQRKRESIAHALQSVIESGDIVRHLFDILDGDSRRLFVLKQEEVGKRGL